MDKLILVLYVDVGNLDDSKINEHVRYVAGSLFTEEVIKKTEATTFVIPVREGGTRVECINPKYVVDLDLYESHHQKLESINKNLDYLIFLMKNDGK